MNRFVQGLLAGIVAVFLTACSSVPPKPFAIDQYERAMVRGTERFHAGELPAALTGFQQALRSAELNDSSERRASALLSIGAVSSMLEEYEWAYSAYSECQREAQINGDDHSTALSQLGLAHLARAKGDVPLALTYYSRVLGGDAKLGAAERMQAENGLALTLAANNQVADALDLLNRLEKQARAQSGVLVSAVLSNQAAMLLMSKQPERALPYAKEALNLDRAEHHPPSIASSHMRLAEVYAKLGRWPEAHDSADRAERIFKYTGQRNTLARLQLMRKNWP